MKEDITGWFAAEKGVEFWDSIYDEQSFTAQCFRQRLAFAITCLDANASLFGKRVLDAGCGTGRLTHEAALRGYRALGLDFSYQMLTRAREHRSSDQNSQPSFLEGGVDALPLQSESFEAAIALGVVAYLQSEERALLELARVLKPGGLLVISMYNKARLVHYLDLPLRLGNFFKRILRESTQLPAATAVLAEPPRKLRTYYVRDFRRALESAGFSVQGYQPVPVELPTVFGKEIIPRRFAEGITRFVEQIRNIPYFESFGAMCIFVAQKKT